MKNYTVYVPSQTYEPAEVAMIEHSPASNTAVLKQIGQQPETYYSVPAAILRVQQKYPNAFAEEQ